MRTALADTGDTAPIEKDQRRPIYSPIALFSHFPSYGFMVASASLVEICRDQIFRPSLRTQNAGSRLSLTCRPPSPRSRNAMLLPSPLVTLPGPPPHLTPHLTQRPLAPNHTRLGCSHHPARCPPRAPPRAGWMHHTRRPPNNAKLLNQRGNTRDPPWPCAGTHEADDAALRGDRRQERGPARRGGVCGGQVRLSRGLQGPGDARRGEGLFRVGV